MAIESRTLRTHKLQIGAASLMAIAACLHAAPALAQVQEVPAGSSPVAPEGTITTAAPQQITPAAPEQS
ncbi:MAG: hypothetical protein EOO77_15860 [Oxalobacteraceae bacterium]|nr:MAG: hypothetical protein EOO77_15860 [Oxalobacteraceae bacterium]